MGHGVRRLPFHRKLQILWVVAHVFLIYALIRDPSVIKLGIALVWTLFINVGSEAGGHRYFAHQSFTTSPWKKNLLIALQTFAGEGSVVAFCGVHRQHHVDADTASDPHSPHHRSALSITYWLSSIHVNPRYVKDCLRDKWVRLQHTQYFNFHALLCLICLLVWGPVAYGYYFCLPIVLILYGNAATNVFGHASKKGYRNFEIKDRSVNVGGVLNFLLMGGGMQNNHHAHPGNYSMKVKENEHDSMGWIIEKFLMDRARS